MNRESLDRLLKELGYSEDDGFTQCVSDTLPHRIRREPIIVRFWFQVM